jgi:TRAP-type C4-dicarboxylate transport system permease small subunit
MIEKIYSPLVGFLHRLENIALISALISMLGIAVLQIFLRNFMDSGFLWAESFLRILVLWVAMLGAMVATREKNHIAIDAMSRYLSRPIQRGTRLLTNLFSSVICGTVAWYSFAYVQLEYEDHAIAFLNVQIWLCQTILPIGFAVISLRFAISVAEGVVENLAESRTGKE